jgi:hypothetical protein
MKVVRAGRSHHASVRDEIKEILPASGGAATAKYQGIRWYPPH